MELREKIKLIRKVRNYTQVNFAKLIDIPFSTFKRYELGDSEVAISAFFKITKEFPEYALWLSSDEVAPESGQIAPGDEAPKMGGNGVPEKLLNAAFEKTITTSISLGWLTAKPEIQFSMLSDLMRHDFVEQGGKLIAQDADANESQTA